MCDTLSNPSLPHGRTTRNPHSQVVSEPSSYAEEDRNGERRTYDGVGRINTTISEPTHADDHAGAAWAADERRGPGATASGAGG